MFTFGMIYCFVHLLSQVAATDRGISRAQPKECTGGSVYFSAHPVDSLLYQNPDLFHDLYVFKCITSVVFTSGDRGRSSAFSRSLEHGLEAAYARMVGTSTAQTAWGESVAQLNGYEVTLRFLKSFPGIQILYLRLPDGNSDGSGHPERGGESLQRLYTNEVRTITAADGLTIYTLESLMGLIAEILKQRAPSDIRILDYRPATPRAKQHDRDHADHAFSARLVMDVMREKQMKGRIVSYAGSGMRELNVTLSSTNRDFVIKVQAFLSYASHENDMCQSYDECLHRSPDSFPPQTIDDVKYVASLLKREYHVL